MLDGIVTWVAGIVAAVAILLLLVFIVKDVIEYLKGQKGIMSIIAKVGCVILIVALIFVAVSFKDKGNSLSEGVGTAIDQGITEINNGIGGGAKGGAGT